MQGVPGAEVLVNLSPMTALWTPTENGRERLLLVRLVRIEEKEVCQGIVLDDAALRGLLADKVADLFPDARLLPVHEPDPPQPDRTMTALPLQLDPGPAPPPPSPGWTPLRVGLALAWTAALVALLAVGLGGWSLHRPVAAPHPLRLGGDARAAHAADHAAAISRHAHEWTGARREAARTNTSTR